MQKDSDTQGNQEQTKELTELFKTDVIKYADFPTATPKIAELKSSAKGKPIYELFESPDGKTESSEPVVLETPQEYRTRKARQAGSVGRKLFDTLKEPAVKSLKDWLEASALVGEKIELQEDVLLENSPGLP